MVVGRVRFRERERGVTLLAVDWRSKREVVRMGSRGRECGRRGGKIGGRQGRQK